MLWRVRPGRMVWAGRMKAGCLGGGWDGRGEKSEWSEKTKTRRNDSNRRTNENSPETQNKPRSKLRLPIWEFPAEHNTTQETSSISNYIPNDAFSLPPFSSFRFLRQDSPNLHRHQRKQPLWLVRWFHVDLKGFFSW